MKKSELSILIIGSQIENKKTGEVLTINNITEIDNKVKYQLSNDKTITASSILRWYNLVPQETVEQVELTVEPEPIPEVEIKPVETKVVEVKPSNNLADEIFDYFTTQQNTFILKHNTDHSVIKANKRKLVEIYVSNNEVTVAVRKELYSEDEQANLDNSRIVKDYAFTLKFKVHSLDEFKSVVNRASVYVPVKK